MHVHFSAEIEQKLRQVAEETGDGTDKYLQELVERYIDHDIWFRQKVQKGIEQLNRGEYLTQEEVGERLNDLFQS